MTGWNKLPIRGIKFEIIAQILRVIVTKIEYRDNIENENRMEI